MNGDAHERRVSESLRQSSKKKPWKQFTFGYSLFAIPGLNLDMKSFIIIMRVTLCFDPSAHDCVKNESPGFCARACVIFIVFVVTIQTHFAKCLQRKGQPAHVPNAISASRTGCSSPFWQCCCENGASKRFFLLHSIMQSNLSQQRQKRDMRTDKRKSMKPYHRGQGPDSFPLNTCTHRDLNEQETLSISFSPRVVNLPAKNVPQTARKSAE